MLQHFLAVLLLKNAAVMKQKVAVKPSEGASNFSEAQDIFPIIRMNLVNIPFSTWTKHVKFHPSPQELLLGNDVYSLLPEVTVLLHRADGKLPLSSVIAGRKAYGNGPELHWGFQMLTEKKQIFHSPGVPTQDLLKLSLFRVVIFFLGWLSKNSSQRYLQQYLSSLFI